MSTPQNQVTGNDDQEFMKFVTDTIAEQVAKQTGQQAPPQTTSIPLTLGGQTITFDSPEALSQAVQGLVSSLQNPQPQPQVPQYVQPQVPQAPANEVTGKDDFDLNTFITKMQADPREGLKYANRDIFGVEDPAAALKDAQATKTKLDQVEKILTMYQFRDNHPEFQGSPQVAQTLESVMQQNGFGLTPAGLEAAYAISIQRGLIPNFYAAQQQGQVAQGGQQSPYAQPQFTPPQFQGGTDPRFFNGGMNFAPPSVPRGGAGPDEANFERIADQMSLEQIEAVFDRFQQR